MVEQFTNKPNTADTANGNGSTTTPDANSNRNWVVSGTNAVDGCSALATSGGVTLTTTTAANDQVIISPNSTGQLGVSGMFNSDKQPVFECYVETGASIAATKIVAGLSLTAALDGTTDDDGIRFAYVAGGDSGKWTLLISRGGEDTKIVVNNAVQASTRYKLSIKVDANLVPYCYINDQLVTKQTWVDNVIWDALGVAAVVANKNLIPFVGVQTTTTAAKAITVIQPSLSRVG